MHLLLVKTHSSFCLVKTSKEIEEKDYDFLPVIIEKNESEWSVWTMDEDFPQPHPFIQNPLYFN